VYLCKNLTNEYFREFRVALTATSYGLQPIKLKIVKNKSLQAKMYKASMNQEQVSTASHVLVFCIENNISEDFINSYFDTIKSTREEDIEGVDAYNKVLIDRFSVKTASQIKDWATKQAYLALGNLLTVCAVEQIDSCPMEGFIPKQIDELPIGKRAEDDENAIHKKVRRPLESIVEVIS